MTASREVGLFTHRSVAAQMAVLAVFSIAIITAKEQFLLIDSALPQP